MVERYRGDPRSAKQINADEKKAGITRQFPGEWSEATFDEIDQESKSGNRSARKARKLLTDRGYDRSGDN